MPDLRFLGLAFKAGKLVIGAEQCAEAANAGAAAAVIAAADVSPNTGEKAGRMAEKCGVPFIELPYTKEQIGSALGRAETGVMVMTDRNFAFGLVSKLREEAPNEYELPYVMLSSPAKKTGPVPGRGNSDNIGRKRGRTHR